MAANKAQTQKRPYRWKSKAARARSTKAGHGNLKAWTEATDTAANLDHGIDAFLEGPRDTEGSAGVPSSG